MHFEAWLTGDAERDLEEIHGYVNEQDDPTKADHILERLVKVIEELSTNPERGSCPKELLVLGIREYRQTFCKPYRAIYRVEDSRVYVYLVADCRRDMEALLTRRLLGA